MCAPKGNMWDYIDFWLVHYVFGKPNGRSGVLLIDCEKIVMEREISWLPRCVRRIYIIPAADSREREYIEAIFLFRLTQFGFLDPRKDGVAALPSLCPDFLFLVLTTSSLRIVL